MTRVFLGLGANIGDRQRAFARALQAISQIPQTHLLRWSPVYETEPVGKKDQPYFLNMAAEIETGLEAGPLLASLKTIEQRLGRTAGDRWGPREIDLDILYYGTTVLNDGVLKIPHPEISNRRFVLVPMHDLAPDFIDPLRQRSVQDLLNACADTNAVRTTQMTIHPAE